MTEKPGDRKDLQEVVSFIERYIKGMENSFEARECETTNPAWGIPSEKEGNSGLFA